MQLSKTNVVKILNRNFGFKKINDGKLGDMIQMNPFDAYLYSTVTGHGYLDNCRQPFTPNGLMQVFNQADAYNLVTGLFDRDGNFLYTPIRQVAERPYLAAHDKFILPIEYDTNAELQNRTSEIEKYLKETKRDPQDFIICRIKRSTAGYSMEPFMEYVASKYFQRKAYFTETQIPFYYSGGTPDFAAYSLPEIRKLIKIRFNFSGSSFIGLASIRAFGLYESNREKECDTDVIVGEAKTVSIEALEQIKKYLSRGIFNKAYEIIPHKKSPEIIAGLFTFNDDGDIEIYEAKTPAQVIPNKQAEYLAWLNNYIKYFLIANLTNEELDEFYSQRTNKKTRSVPELLSFVNNLNHEEILDKVAEYIHG